MTIPKREGAGSGQGEDPADSQDSSFPETVIATGRKRPRRYVPHEPFPDTVKASLEPQESKGGSGRRALAIVTGLALVAAACWAAYRYL